MKTALVLVAALAAFGVKADLCESIESMASSIMEARQAGVPASKLVGIINQDMSKELAELGISIVKAAYSKPHYSTESYQQRETTDFANEWYLACLNQDL